jgi:hypothetical protein
LKYIQENKNTFFLSNYHTLRKALVLYIYILGWYLRYVAGLYYFFNKIFRCRKDFFFKTKSNNLGYSPNQLNKLDLDESHEEKKRQR